MFSSLLLSWYEHAHRDLPWRRSSDAYAIWVSEIMLQQTRVAAVIPFYARFLQRFPDVTALANASEEELLHAWAGLGYYSRVRNMQKAAQVIRSRFRGTFPWTYEEIRELPGIGDYTAAAIASIAFELPHAAVDGNVLRVLSRVTNDAGDIGAGTVRQRLQSVAETFLDRSLPGRYNQALMELGATICLPKKPMCVVCPVAECCEARAAGRQNELPVKIRRIATIRKTRRLYVIQSSEGLLLWQRTNKSEKLAGFWELPEIEHFESRAPRGGKAASVFKHSITNHEYTFEVVISGKSAAKPPQLRPELVQRWIRREELPSVVLSTTARKALLRCSVLPL